MVSSIVPGTTGAHALGVDPRNARLGAGVAEQRPQSGQGDRVELTSGALATARESVGAGVTQVHEALAVGQDAQALLLKVQVLARAGGPQSDLDAALSGYAQRVDAAIARGAAVLAGHDISVAAEPGGAPITIPGADLRLHDGADAGVLKVIQGANVADPALAQDAQRSLDLLQEAMTRLMGAARALETHQGFLGAIEGSLGGRADFDAESARLLALQVRQGLEAAGAAPIANADPQAVLALFRA